MLLAYSANDIDAAGTALDADLPTSWLAEELTDASLTADAPGHVTGRLSRSAGDDIVVRARVRVSLKTPCARCLDPARLDVDTEISLLLRPVAPKLKVTSPKSSAAAAKAAAAKKGAAKEDEEYEFTSAEADVDAYDGETVVLDPFVREAILLEVPNFPLCSESCPGIARAAEEGRVESSPGLDPRLAPLAALKLKGLNGAGNDAAPKASKAAKAEASPARPKTKKNKE
jgi:uncharacterized protein